MAKAKDWKSVLKQYRTKVKAGNAEQNKCVTKAMLAATSIGGGYIGDARKIVCGHRVNNNVIRYRAN